MRMLNTGPAKHAVIAMFASPFRAMVTLADQSAIELPQARTVMPIMELGLQSSVDEVRGADASRSQANNTTLILHNSHA